MKKQHEQQVSVCVIAITIVSLCAAQDMAQDVLCKTKEDVSRTGICIDLNTQLKDCTQLYTLLKIKNFTALRDSFCEGNNDIRNIKVCCPVDDYRERREQENEPDYNQHPNFHLLPTPETSACGVGASSDRIIGGLAAAPGDFPWMARIGLQRDGEIDFTCGGTIINKRYVMTSAHCFKSNEKLAVVRLAETDDTTDEDCVKRGTITVACSQTQDYEHEKIIIHPGYTGKSGSQDDIALIRLNKDITNLTSYFTRPICLPFVKEYGLESLEDNNLQTRKGTITGWGKTSNYGIPEGSHNLQYVLVPIKPNAACRAVYSSNNVTYNQVCAGGTKNDVCLGDSGSPLTSTVFSSKGPKTLRHYQIGIVSFGRAKCATEDVPVVYTRVRSYLKWILDNIYE